MKDKRNEGTLIIQTDEPDPEHNPWTSLSRINSGFYHVDATNKSIEMFEAIIKTSARSNSTEQPHFYQILCGNKKEYVVDSENCFRDGMMTKLLDPKLYPNGASYAMWNATDIAKQHPDVFVLHNNWIIGIDGKFNRRKQHGYDYFDMKHQVCKRSWLKTNV